MLCDNLNPAPDKKKEQAAEGLHIILVTTLEFHQQIATEDYF
jgi:hypothetical protein